MNQIKRHVEWLTTFSFWRRTLFFGGLLLLICPPIGWLIAMGYRRSVGRLYLNPRNGALPELSQWWMHLLNGLKAFGVVLLYIAPSYCLLWGGIFSRYGVAEPQLQAFVEMTAASLLLLPLGLPLTVVKLFCFTPWFAPIILEAVLVGIVFLLGVFLIPAAFVHVSWHDSFAQAFRFREMLRFISERWKGYLSAWFLSCVVAFVPLLVVPLAPWVIFGSYQLIVLLFSEEFLHWKEQRLAALREGAGCQEVG